MSEYTVIMNDDMREHVTSLIYKLNNEQIAYVYNRLSENKVAVNDDDHFFNVFERAPVSSFLTPERLCEMAIGEDLSEMKNPLARPFWEAQTHSLSMAIAYNQCQPQQFLEKPLTAEELQVMGNDNGYIDVIVASQHVCNDLEEYNDKMEGEIVTDGYIQDIHYDDIFQCEGLNFVRVGCKIVSDY